MKNTLTHITLCLTACALMSCTNSTSKTIETTTEDTATAVDGTRIDDEYTSDLVVDSSISEKPTEVEEKVLENKTPAKKVNTPPPPPPIVEKTPDAKELAEEEVVEEQEEVSSITLFFQEANTFFSKNVRNGKVDYAGIKANPKQLNEIVNYAKSSEPGSGNTYKAFYINAYNIMTIKGIIDNYPISSPLDKDGFFDKIKYNVAGESITLNDIENKKLRAVLNDARIHFVLVCGAQSCPPIISKAYTASNVNALLEARTKTAINSNYFVKVNESDKTLMVSHIMKWYKEDFVSSSSTEIDFINKYRKNSVPSDYSIEYREYDWKLNEQ